MVPSNKKGTGKFTIGDPEMPANFFPNYLTVGQQYAAKMSLGWRPGQSVYSTEVALRENIDARELLNLDPDVRFAKNHACISAIGNDIKFVPATSDPKDRKKCEIYREWYEETEGNLNTNLLMAECLLIDGEYFGYYDGYRKRINLGNMGTFDWYLPQKIRNISRYRFERITQKDGKVDLKMYRPQTRTWEFLNPQQRRNLIYKNNSDDETRMGFGNGLIDPLYVAYALKKKFEGDMIDLMTRVGGGIWDIGIDDINEGDTYRTLDALQALYEQKLAQAMSMHVFTRRKQDEFNIKEPPAQSFQSLSQEIDRQVLRIYMLLMGAVLQVAESQFGTRAQSVTHKESSNNHVRPTAVNVSEIWTFQVFRKIFEFYNSHIFNHIGLKDARPPLFMIPQDRKDDFEKNVRIMKDILDSGAPIKKEQIYELSGVEQPLPGDELIHPKLESIQYPLAPSEDIEDQPQALEDIQDRAEDKAEKEVKDEGKEPKPDQFAILKTENSVVKKRADLPQIPEEKTSQILQNLKDLGIKTKEDSVYIDFVKPSQPFVDGDKIASMANSIMERKPIWLSSDCYVVDGHHRFYATKSRGEKMIDCIIVDCPFFKIVPIFKEILGE